MTDGGEDDFGMGRFKPNQSQVQPESNNRKSMYGQEPHVVD